MGQRTVVTVQAAAEPDDVQRMADAVVIGLSDGSRKVKVGSTLGARWSHVAPEAAS